MTTVNVLPDFVVTQSGRCMWGHRARCLDCGWESPAGRLTHAGAVLDGLMHVSQIHPNTREDH